MDKKFFNIITMVAFVLLGTNASFAIDEDGFQVQSLSVDNSIVDNNKSTINMSTEKFPQIKKEETNNSTNNQQKYLTPEDVYPQYNPYAYNTNYVQYKKVIGPYYTTGINRGFGFNYKGFGYNYQGHGYNYGYSVSNKYPIYVSPPPPPPPHHMRPPIHGHGGIHHGPHYHH